MASHITQPVVVVVVVVVVIVVIHGCANAFNAQDQAAAQALVSARPEGSHTQPTGEVAEDPELRRAKELVELHYSVKVAQQKGLYQDLNKAREDVRRVMQEMNGPGR